MEKYYARKRDYWQTLTCLYSRPPAGFVCVPLTQIRHFYIFEVQKLNVWRKKMKVKPLGDRVMVKLEKSETKSTGGIIIPDTAQEKTQQGTVIEVGPGTEKDPIHVKVGQKVMYDKYAGTQIKVNGEEHLILKMADIIAVVE
jgi:chaperonin GroES